MINAVVYQCVGETVGMIVLAAQALLDLSWSAPVELYALLYRRAVLYFPAGTDPEIVYVRVPVVV